MDRLSGDSDIIQKPKVQHIHAYMNLSGKRTESKKIQKKNSRGTKKAVRRNEKIPEARFFAVFFNQSHVLQEKSRRRWHFFSQNGADV